MTLDDLEYALKKICAEHRCLAGECYSTDNKLHSTCQVAKQIDTKIGEFFKNTFRCRACDGTGKIGICTK